MKELKEENKNEINKGLVFVDFWAEWCAPCKMLGPIFESLESEMPNISFYKNNVEEYSDFAKAMNIISIPTMILFRDGKEVFRVIGTKTKKEILDMFDLYPV